MEVPGVQSLVKRDDPKLTAKFERDAKAIESITKNDSGDSNQVSFQELYKSLSITAENIVDKINEQLGIALPDGVQSLRPEEVTPEATSDRIVSGITAFYSTFAKQNSQLADEEVLNRFLSEAKRGINAGYSDAISILENLGAFTFDGVKEGVEATRVLIDEKLAKFEEQKKIELGLLPPPEEASASETEAQSS